MTPPLASTATRFGWSYISTWVECPMRWFNRYLRPGTVGTVGREPAGSNPNLMLGSAVHAGLAAYYLSGWDPEVHQDTGHYDLVEACEKAYSYAIDHAAELEDATDAQTVANSAVTLLQSYAEFWSTEFPTYAVAAGPDGEPLVEREFEIEIAPGRVFTTRLDLVARYEGRYTPIEHKTQAASRVWALIASAHINGQFTGELLATRAVFGEHAGNPQLNILVKDRGTRSKGQPFIREPIGRTDDEIAKFRTDVIRTLDEIDATVARYNDLVKMGMSPNTAANRVFHATRQTMACVGFGKCPYYGPCKARGNEQAIFDSLQFKPARQPADTSKNGESE